MRDHRCQNWHQTGTSQLRTSATDYGTRQYFADAGSDQCFAWQWLPDSLRPPRARRRAAGAKALQRRRPALLALLACGPDESGANRRLRLFRAAKEAATDRTGIQH